jgi:hypothetical protein
MRIKKLYEYIKLLHTYKGRKITDISHSEEQFYNRTGLDFDIYLDTIEKGIDRILTEYNDEENQFIIVNTKYDFGIQVNWRPDLRSNDPTNHAYTATTLGNKERKYYTRQDIEIFVEQLKKLKESSYMKSYYRLDHLDEDMEALGYDLFIESGKIYYTYDIIRVD